MARSLATEHRRRLQDRGFWVLYRHRILLETDFLLDIFFLLNKITFSLLTKNICDENSMELGRFK